ncbi:AraC family transcriptional regulator [Reyranella sp.]|uniref:AraC family transcriptional regulator n=1 Tax=Reyranella sp. TaxID=1929291 RepID=UPI0012014F7A|nr:AraC family transcriptional regulator [Reyranella sp.]TAJ86703.1 MAG: AraC family transcriptional regulator [Reyranella sp.]
MDILSDVLRVVRLSGAIHFCAEFTEPWAILTSPPEMLTVRLVPGAEAVIPFHIATGGRCWLSWGKVEPIGIEAGDVLVFARGAQHVLASGPGVTPVPIKDIYRPVPEQITVLRHGGGGEESHFVCGFLHSDQRFGPLLDAMPALACVRVRDGTIRLETFTDTGRYAEPIVLEQDPQWWTASIDHLVGETAKPGPGNRAVLARLSELLFTEVVRWLLTSVGEGRRGWLAGLADPHVGRALNLLHAEPARAWTVAELARQAGLSRAALAKHFVELVGETPMQYLAGWRMHLARRELRDSTLGLAEIGARVGYESEAAFSRAFRRLVGAPPASWRQANLLSASAHRVDEPAGHSA